MTGSKSAHPPESGADRPRRPLIAITGPDRGGWPAWFFTALAVRRAGGRPLRLRPGRPRRHRHFDALIVGGGADVDPQLYENGDSPQVEEIRAAESNLIQRLIGYVFYPLLWLLRLLFQSHGGILDLQRDALEKELIGRALAADKPILGICRGMQLINVVRGGNLNRNLEGFYTETPKVRSLLPVKRIRLEAESRLSRVTGTETLLVNALHNQAVDALGRNLRVCAREDNGVVQAIEASDHWCLGVQWHPEYLPQKEAQQRLFRALVKAAGRRD